ncbi:unnamed protein product [Clonostachys rhizophaga]|uniref:Uncharacterized protein n=1 Tax=Clonostachys rhizophaga TaxID=160324 RepID=A0A9N9YR09_9HYPO|nr:unnamed protein product [Clonostachys rhizophaga]
MARSISSKLLATSLATAIALGGTYGFLVHQRVKAVDRKRITIRDTAPDAFRQSKSIKDIVNIKGHRDQGDSRHITVEIPAHLQNEPDEALLARFVKGFFGGIVIGPERLTLQTLGLNLVKFTSAHAPSTGQRLWSTKDLQDNKLPPLHSVLFGVFQVTDKNLAERSGSEPSESYVDFAFGSDETVFAGAHRFAVVRYPRSSQQPADEPTTVQIHSQSIVCNPLYDRPLRPQFMFTFHLAYADLLFRDAIAEVTQWLQG